MAVYQVTAPDGTKYRVTGPDNAKEADLIRAVQEQQFEERAEEIRKLREPLPAPATEPTVAGQTKEFFKGIVPGAVS